MPNSNNKDHQSLKINFAASHDQASLQNELASNYKKLNEIGPILEKIQEDLQSDSETHSAEAEAEAIKLLAYARQIFNDIKEITKKLSTIYLHTPEEKLKSAKSLLATHKPLTVNEEYRFKEIEEALSNTCIIKSAGDETIKFQLGILGYEKDSNMITESEFNYLVVPRLKDNNLLDSYRVRIEVEKSMILKRTPLEICQAINKALSGDPDYQDSNNLFVLRLNGIDFELSLQRLENIDRECRDLTLLQKECMSLSFQNSDDSFEEELSYPELPTHPIELNAQQPSNEPPININHTEEDQKKSEFVSLIQELIPQNKKNEIQIDEISPIAVEKIMRISLQRPSPLSEEEKRKLNYSMIMKAEKITGDAVAKVQNNIENPSYANDGSFVYEGMIESLSKLKNGHAEKLQETKPCQLTGEKLVHEYFKFGKRNLEGKIKKIENQMGLLNYNKKHKLAEFDKNTAQYDNLANYQIEMKRDTIYFGKKQELDLQFNDAMKKQALWEGKKTFTQSVEKNGKIKQEEKSFSEKELHFRNLVLDFNSNQAKNKTINVYQDGVYLISDKKAKPSIQLSSTRATFKSFTQGQISSSLYSVKNTNQSTNPIEKNCKLAGGTRLLRS